MAQPHFRTPQLIQLLDALRPTTPKLRLPDWLSGLLEQLCEFIEPIQGEARVGYDCRYIDPLWQIDLFLGKNECVGGSLDGFSGYVNYTANVAGILGLFTSVRRCEWLALPGSGATRLSNGASGLAIEGEWEGQTIRVVLRMTPPEEMGIGLKLFPDGTYTVAPSNAGDGVLG